MVTNVVGGLFGPKDDNKVEKELQVWTCACGNQTFSLFNDARVQCAYCEQIICDTCADEEGWRKVLPPSPEKAKQDSAGAMRIHSAGDVDLARARTWRHLEGWMKNGELEFIYGGDVKGATRAWVGIDNEKDRLALLEQLDDFRVYVEGLKFDGANNDDG